MIQRFCSLMIASFLVVILLGTSAFGMGGSVLTPTQAPITQRTEIPAVVLPAVQLVQHDNVWIEKETPMEQATINSLNIALTATPKNKLIAAITSPISSKEALKMLVSNRNYDDSTIIVFGNSATSKLKSENVLLRIRTLNKKEFAITPKQIETLTSKLESTHSKSEEYLTVVNYIRTIANERGEEINWPLTILLCIVLGLLCGAGVIVSNNGTIDF